MWKVKRLELLEKLAEKHLSERYEIANEFFFKKKLLKNLENERLKELLETPIGFLPKEERDAYYLLFLEEPGDSYTVVDGKEYSKDILKVRLIDVIYKQLLAFDTNLDSDSFKITPVFSFKNDLDVMTGFMSFIRDPQDSHHIVEIGIFSFNIYDKSFGKQVWEDFDEQLINYLREGYTIEWSASIENKACKHYDELIKNFHGAKQVLDTEVRYRLGEKKCQK